MGGLLPQWTMKLGLKQSSPVKRTDDWSRPSEKNPISPDRMVRKPPHLAVVTCSVGSVDPVLPSAATSGYWVSGDLAHQATFLSGVPLETESHFALSWTWHTM
ncbi:uncharacterized protein LOC144204207 isoform X2 [Stigmatopora nigra]